MASLPSVGFLGLGIMGMPMARHLAAAGYPVTVYNRTAARAETARDFAASVARTPKDAADRSQVLITMVSDAPQIHSLLEGPDGVLATSNPSLIWVQTSTIGIEETQEFGEMAARRGWRYLDCPVAGSKAQVEAAQLILLAGGAEDLVEEVRPILLAMGKAIVHAGEVGAGSALKLCMNLIVAQMTTALAESAALAEAAALDPAKIFEVLRQSPALDCGYFRIKERTLLEKDFAPAFSLNNVLKDVRYMTREAATRRLRLPVTQAVRTLMEESVALGHGDEDLMSIFVTLKRA